MDSARFGRTGPAEFRAEEYNNMALTQTTGASAFSATDQFLNVTSATGFAAGNFVRVDSEFMLVSPSYVSGTMIPVHRRGDQGSRVVAHNALAIVVTGLNSDIAA